MVTKAVIRWPIALGIVALLGLVGCEQILGPTGVDKDMTVVRRTGGIRGTRLEELAPFRWTASTLSWFGGPVGIGKSGAVRGADFTLLFVTTYPDMHLFALHFVNDGLLGCRAPTMQGVGQPFQFEPGTFVVDFDDLMWVTVFDNEPMLSRAVPCETLNAAILAEGVAKVSINLGESSAKGRLELVDGGYADYSMQLQFERGQPVPRIARIDLTPIRN